MTKEIINLKDYFVHHYDDWGRLYCVEFKGNPLELENSIKCLEQENEKLKKTLQEIKEIINTCLEFKTCEKCKFYKACNRDLEGCILTLIKKAEEE